jgi:hypothetical protein
LFAITTKKKNLNAMATSLLPSFSLLQAEKRKNWVMATSLLPSPCSQQKIDEEKKKQWHA